MSQEERLQILQMVADKKITATEAVELLKALESKAPPVGATPPVETVAAARQVPVPPLPEAPRAPEAPVAPQAAEPPVAPADQPEPGPSQSAEPAGSGFTAGPTPPPTPNRVVYSTSGSNIASNLATFIEDVVDTVTSVFSEFGGSRYEFPWEFTGTFEAVEPALRIFTGNGKVEVRVWDEPGFKANVLVKARGANEQEARSRARDAFTVRADGTGFTLETRRIDWDWRGMAVNVVLMVPRDKYYQLEARTGNGHMDLIGLAAANGQITTGNGHLHGRGILAHTLRMKTGNGSIEIEGDVGDLEASSGNGSVLVQPSGNRMQRVEVHTGNGSVRVDTRRLPQTVGFKVDAKTGMGGIEVAVPNLVFDRDDRSVGHKHIVARSAGYEQAWAQVNISARTGMGSVTVE
jgi:DUF4097 and DUF4098 domain-containing protein YvlB